MKNYMIQISIDFCQKCIYVYFKLLPKEQIGIPNTRDNDTLLLEMLIFLIFAKGLIYIN